MQCPRCAEDLAERRLAHSDVDECSGCGGIWFDEGELKDARDAADPDLSWRDLDVLGDASRFAVSTEGRGCPRCDRPMATVDYDAAGLRLDCCPVCRGIWLDPGEFQALVSLLQREATAMNVPAYVHEALDEAADLLRSDTARLPAEWQQLGAVLRMLQYRMLAENPKLASVLAAIGEGAAKI
jgi:uncharacterized protein